MKNIGYSLLIGIVIGSVITFSILNKSIPISASLLVSSSNPHALISQTNLIVQHSKNHVKSIASFHTDQSGFYTNTIVINKKEIQYKHNIYLHGGYWLQTQMPTISLGYSYQYFLFNINIGYSLKYHHLDYGLSLGTKFAF